MLVNSKKLLTIAIPTFDRNEILLRNIEKILPQVKDWVEIFVVDNHSKIPVADTLEFLISNNRNACIRIYRNTENIGVNANVLRCIEFCESEYIWVLGDDDFPLSTALETIHAIIVKKEAVWLNFYESYSVHQPRRSRDSILTSLPSFLMELVSISELVFISNNVYRTACMKKGLEIGNLHQSIMAPHLVSMIAGIELSPIEGNYHISTEQLFESISNNEDAKTAWPLYKAFVGIMSLYQVPFTRTVSRQINRLVQGARHQWLGNKSLVVAFSNLSLANGIRDSFRGTATFLIALLVVDRLHIVISFPLYLAAILFARPIHYGLKLRSSWRQKK